MTSHKTFKKSSPCPVCGGYGGAYKSENKCKGFLSSQEDVAFCQKEESSESLILYGGLLLYKHSLTEVYSRSEGESSSFMQNSADSAQSPRSEARKTSPKLLKPAYQSRQSRKSPPQNCQSGSDPVYPAGKAVQETSIERDPSCDGVVPSPESSAEVHPRPRRIVAETRMYPAQGPYREADVKSWWVVLDSAGEEVTRSLRLDHASLFL